MLKTSGAARRLLRRVSRSNHGNLANTVGLARVGIVGTFDVENYGDLLFPLMAEAALARSGNSFEVIPFSPNRRSENSWPFRVHSTSDIPEFLPNLSALLVGGGQLIRFDKTYPLLADPDVKLPIGYWLIPAVLGALSGKPVVWNAIGAFTASAPAPWHDEVVKTVLSASYLVGVRDKASRQHLAKMAPSVKIELIPDTVFSISRLWPLALESQEYVAWRKSVRLAGKYFVIQADRAIAAHRARVSAITQSLPHCTAVILPVCRCHGDRAENFVPPVAQPAVSAEWLSPRLISEIIGRSELTVASSLHACITALSYGAPVVRFPSFNATDRKFELLDEFDGIAAIENPAAVTAVIHRGRQIEPRAVKCADRLDDYWQRVVNVALDPTTHDSQRSAAMMLRWVSRIFDDIENSAVARRASSGMST